jgi:hypothetical protein
VDSDDECYIGWEDGWKTLDDVVQHLKTIVYPFGQGERAHSAPQPVEQDSNKLLAGFYYSVDEDSLGNV